MVEERRVFDDENDRWIAVLPGETDRDAFLRARREGAPSVLPPQGRAAPPPQGRPSSYRIAAQQAAARDAADLAHRADEIKRWEAAYALAHDGQEPPPGYVLPVPIAPRATTGQTNSMAIAALVSVFFISWVGIILGNIALKQIETTGEEGAGLARAAVIIGWVSVALGVLALLIYWGTINSLRTQLGY
jgi:peptidyl-prolyl cis-trans isomerase B (cyclophilin B)